MWRIEYDRTVRNYIYDSYPYTENVWRAIKSLRQTTNGLPAEAVTQLEPEVYLWIVEEHQVVYRRIEATQVLRVIVLKPLV
jgi:adenylate kinase family enzyme